MNEIEMLEEKMINLDKHVRVALLTECATRVFPIYEECWVGTYDEEVANSIALAWNFALGDEVNDKEFQACLVELEDIVEYYYEEGISVLAKSVSVVLFLLQSMFVEEDKSSVAITQGLLSTIDVAVSAEAMANSKTPFDSKEKIAVFEENKWQEQAIYLAENWNGIPTRNMFHSLGGQPPNWLTDWKTRCDFETKDNS